MANFLPFHPLSQAQCCTQFSDGQHGLLHTNATTAIWNRSVREQKWNIYMGPLVFDFVYERLILYFLHKKCGCFSTVESYLSGTVKNYSLVKAFLGIFVALSARGRGFFYHSCWNCVKILFYGTSLSQKMTIFH